MLAGSTIFSKYLKLKHPRQTVVQASPCSYRVSDTSWVCSIKSFSCVWLIQVLRPDPLQIPCTDLCAPWAPRNKYWSLQSGLKLLLLLPLLRKNNFPGFNPSSFVIFCKSFKRISGFQTTSVSTGTGNILKHFSWPFSCSGTCR